MTAKHRMAWCNHCQDMIAICGKCGNNCCNGGYGELPDGSECDACPSAYEFQEKHIHYRDDMNPPTVIIRPLSEEDGGGFFIEDLTRPGCMSDGVTEFEALASLMDARRGWDIVDAERKERKARSDALDELAKLSDELGLRDVFYGPEGEDVTDERDNEIAALRADLKQIEEKAANAALWNALAVNLSPIGTHLHNGSQTTSDNINDLRDAVLVSLRRQGFDVKRSA